jgi:hypothetical protein
MDPNLAFEDHVELAGKVAPPEDVLAGVVAAGDHQLVDAAQLLQREGGEKGHLFQRDEVFHGVSGSAANRLGRPPDPAVRVALEQADLLLGERPCRAALEALRISQPNQRPDQPSRAEVYQRFNRLSPCHRVI